MDVLHPFSAGLIRGIHIDGRHQFTESIRGEFFNIKYDGLGYIPLDELEAKEKA